MIKSFKHKGLEQFYLSSNKAGIKAAHSAKLKLLLTALNAATQPQDMNAPSWKLHQLKGNLQGHWAVTVNGNWRLTFKFDGNDAEIVDYQDYH
ncbi:MAG: type II toxin-antitoxin system RelE/ParE family toxin [Snodgrassella alvi]|nr:type II toxin-antitoxin system RelE/ParE family toxin [Snodgrassella alvi]